MHKDKLRIIGFSFLTHTVTQKAKNNSKMLSHNVEQQELRTEPTLFLNNIHDLSITYQNQLRQEEKLKNMQHLQLKHNQSVLIIPEIFQLKGRAIVR